MLNGALIALGALAILDNVVVHWLLGWHRAVPGPHALTVEWSLIALGWFCSASASGANGGHGGGPDG